VEEPLERAARRIPAGSGHGSAVLAAADSRRVVLSPLPRVAGEGHRVERPVGQVDAVEVGPYPLLQEVVRREPARLNPRLEVTCRLVVIDQERQYAIDVDPVLRLFRPINLNGAGAVRTACAREGSLEHDGPA